MEVLKVMVFIVATLFASSVAWTDEFKSWRVRIARLLVPLPPENPVAKALRERKERFEQYAIEYLAYGFNENQAVQKAEERMQAEAKAAEGVKP